MQMSYYKFIELVENAKGDNDEETQDGTVVKK